AMPNHRKPPRLKGWASKHPRSSHAGGDYGVRCLTAALAASFNPKRVRTTAGWYQYISGDRLDTTRPAGELGSEKASQGAVGCGGGRHRGDFDVRSGTEHDHVRST